MKEPGSFALQSKPPLFSTACFFLPRWEKWNQKASSHKFLRVTKWTLIECCLRPENTNWYDVERLAVEWTWKKHTGLSSFRPGFALPWLLASSASWTRKKFAFCIATKHGTLNCSRFLNKQMQVLFDWMLKILRQFVCFSVVFVFLHELHGWIFQLLL